MNRIDEILREELGPVEAAERIADLEETLLAVARVHRARLKLDRPWPGIDE